MAENNKGAQSTADIKDSSGRHGPFRFFTKRDVVLAAVLSAALGLLVFFFAPMETIFGNQQEFTVNASDILWPMLLLSLTAAAALMLVQMIALVIHKNAFFVVSRLLLGLLIAFYIQSLFLNGKMREITGDGLYSGTKAGMVVNAVIFFAIVLLPLCLNIIVRLKKPDMTKGFFRFIPVYICGVILVLQGMGMVDSVIKSDAEDAVKAYDKVFSYSPMMSLSKENNVVVFVIDRMDSRWTDTMLQRNPELYDKLEGFTFYQNNMSHYSNTFPSIPSTLTGCFYDNYDNASKTAYLKEAWERHTALDVMKENGIKINMALDSSATFSSVNQLDKRCDNLISAKEMRDGFNYFGMKGILLTMSRLSMAKLSPYCLKGTFAKSLSSDLSAKFVTYQDSSDFGIISPSVGTDSDKQFYEYIKSHPLRADSAEPVFNFVHLNGMHTRSEDIARYYYGDREFKNDIYATGCGELQIVFTYLDMMKEQGVYDSSTIIIFADHGRVHEELDIDNKDHIEFANVATLLVKPAGAPRESLKLDPKSELSNDYMAASFLEYFGIDHSDFGYSYNDIINGDLHIERTFNPFRWKVSGYVKLNEYKVLGNARDFSIWREIFTEKE